MPNDVRRRPEAPYRLDHVAIGVPSIRRAAGELEAHLRARRFSAGPGAGFVWAQWEFQPGARLELMEPDGPPGGFLHRFLDRRGPGVHHVTFKVPSLAEAAERARAFGYEIVGYDDSHPSWKEAFLHPKQAQGLVVQLAEAPGEEKPIWMGPLALPDPPAAAEPPPALAALHLAARSREAAERQWCELLGGEGRWRDGRLELGWPRSPLRIVVEVDAAGPEGPRWIELGGAVAPPASLAEVLGTRFAGSGANG